LRRGFLLFALFVAGVFYGWNRGISRDGLARYIDAHPRTFKGDALLYTLGSFHELFNRPDRAVSMYERVVVLYPDSPHAEACLYGVASNFERLKNFARARQEYEKYIEEYPEGRYAVSVKKNIEFLKGL
jgi:TolA-binding protein